MPHDAPTSNAAKLKKIACRKLTTPTRNHLPISTQWEAFVAARPSDEGGEKTVRSVFWTLLTATRSCRDLDQVKADIASMKHLSQYQSTKAAEDLPGLGEHYCIECAKWFEGERNLAAHRKGKNHKRR